MSTAIGTRELKEHLSEILARVRAGEVVTVTQHRKAVARLVPIGTTANDDVAAAKVLVEAGLVSWNGQKPRGLDDAPDMRGVSVSDLVIEDRG
jgi:prevent-host-death family protein